MSSATEREFTTQAKRFAAFGLVLTLGFGLPLWTLLRFSLRSDFFSYIPLVPLISVYFIGLERSQTPHVARPHALGAILSGVAGLALLGLEAWLGRANEIPDASSYLALLTASYLLLLLAGGFYFLGADVLRVLAFPVGFLVFFIPPPMFLLDPTVAFFQHASSRAAVAMLDAADTPVLVGASGLDLQLPGMTLHVAPECSGIHSTMVLLMTSLIAGQMFLHSNWRRSILVLFVVPLAVLRNGFRIFVIGELCVHVGPQMIDSPIHHHGGPIFFALSLIPFFGLLLLLRKKDVTQTTSDPLGTPVSNPL